MPRLTDDRRLQALRETELLDAPSRASLDRYVRIASAALRVPVSLISLVDDHRQFFTSAVGLPEPWASARQTPLTHSFCQHVVADGRSLVVEDAREHPLVRDNLAVRDLAVVAYAGMPVGTADGSILGSFCAIDSSPRQWTPVQLGVLQDLSAAVSEELELRRRAVLSERSESKAAALHEALIRTEEAFQRRAAAAAHDLRNPLGVVMLGIQGLMKHQAAASFPELARMLEMIDRNASHAVSLVGSMNAAGLEIAEAGGVELTHIAEEIAVDSRSRRPALAFTLSAEASPLHVAGSATDVRRAVVNLVTNAERFARSQVAIAVERLSGETRLAVDDDGPGLPSAQAYERVWEPNVRFHVEERLSGRGLGLSIVRDVMTRAGGTVRAEPSPSLGGARFVMIWPDARAV